MKSFRKGFTLSEVLLALTIVAIIATIGFTMSRQGVERAYKMYIYNGYKTISTAIAEANMHGYCYQQIVSGDPDEEAKRTGNEDFIAFIHELITNEKFDRSENFNLKDHVITTANGIEYSFEPKKIKIADGTSRDVVDEIQQKTVTVYGAIELPFLDISMTVPGYNEKEEIHLMYYNYDYKRPLTPYIETQNGDDFDVATKIVGDMSMLPFKFVDGQYTETRSFSGAICDTLGNLSVVKGSIEVDDVTLGTGVSTGAALPVGQGSTFTEDAMLGTTNTTQPTQVSGTSLVDLNSCSATPHIPYEPPSPDATVELTNPVSVLY